MALTGIAIMGFVLAHMIGNLKMYLGPAEFDRYGEFLRELLVPILPRTVVPVADAHRPDRRLRPPHPRRLRVDDHQPQGPAGEVPVVAATTSPPTSPAARCAGRHHRRLFLFFHLADLTWGWFNPDFVRGDAVPQRRRQPVSGCRSRCSTSSPTSPSASTCSTAPGACSSRSGWNNPRFNRWRRGFATAFAAVIVVGNVSFPVAVLAGIVGK